MTMTELVPRYSNAGDIIEREWWVRIWDDEDRQSVDIPYEDYLKQYNLP